MERFWHLGPTNQPPLFPRQVFPRSQGPFVRRARHSSGHERELVVGQWGLIPWFAKEPKLKVPTNNARSEELAEKASYKDPWMRGQRCIIPAASFDEPNWETGKNIWWQFSRADGTPWGLAGLWNVWTNKDTGEVHESYTMLTLNADDHPLMSRMHKPDPKFAPRRAGQAQRDPDRGRQCRPVAGRHCRRGQAVAAAVACRSVRCRPDRCAIVIDRGDLI